ncbi:MAG TPA: TPM domain-containing protein [Tenuifilaceae bacterium]|nr:TPM domain-containing protein [Tenuifilaceae bacterium]HPI45844.1 TPM domain-containing protein [Tenuifilaceae bacterium]HPN22140.1 TPM domain-containing protein [Tenuifilaceae bacterium]HPV57876.1 TPM domain-containing protein [Tenuifilaceae bacterium]HSA04561.1 TPM domain-containing protein [Tenuifilaceae bacterium]
MKPKDYFTPDQQKQIVDAIEEAELNTSGEIRVHIDLTCKGDVLDQAAKTFAMLKMHKTKLRNGVLFYLSIQDHKFAILGDAGINAQVPENFWENTKQVMFDKFKENNLAEGLVTGITLAGEQLKKYFPYKDDDINELDNNISFG